MIALRAAGCDAPVHAGVMVAKNASALRRVASMAGIEALDLDHVPFDGARIAGEMAAELWRVSKASAVPVAGIHFFGMNDTALLCESVRCLHDAIAKTTVRC